MEIQFLYEHVLSFFSNYVFWKSPKKGAGDAEYFFWKNYFYHCAMKRFKLGLSNKELWDVPTISLASTSQTNTATTTSTSKTTATTSSSTLSTTPQNNNNIGDDGKISVDSISRGSSSASLSVTGSTGMGGTNVDEAGITGTMVSSSVSEKDYEIIPPLGARQNDTGGDDDGDDELDDLEAEIARELES